MVELRGLNGLSLFALLGALLILAGLLLLLIPLISKLGVRLENIHPLLLVWKKLDGLYVGTSPIVLIVLVILYMIAVFLRKG